MCQSLTQYKKDLRLKWIVLDLYRIPGNYIGLLNSQYTSWALYVGHEWQAALQMALLDSAEIID